MRNTHTESRTADGASPPAEEIGAADILGLIKGEWLDYALTLGMSAEEYWHADPSLIYNYERSFANRRKIREEEIWLQGAYIRSALASVVVPVGIADAGTSRRLPEYAPNPVRECASSADEAGEAERAKLYFDTLMKVNNKRGDK